jgi:hypothetical protein
MTLRALLASLALACLAACGGGDDQDLDLPDVAVGYMELCNPDLEPACLEASDTCFSFNMKGPHCTRDCDGPEDCPAPSTGCNNMGVCKAP